MPAGSVIVRSIVGVLLLTAAFLKYSNNQAGAFETIPLLAVPVVQQLAILVEVLLGLWLLSGWQPWFSWASAVIVFATFSALSAYQWNIGESTCNCFGRIEIHPGYTLLLDLLVFGCLLLFRPALPVRNELIFSLKQLGKLVGAAGFVLIAGYLTVVVTIGDPSSALAVWGGEKALMTPVITDVGSGNVGDVTRFEIELKNLTSQPVKVLGGTRSCTCIASNDLPLTLQPNATAKLTVIVRFTGTPGRFVHRYNFLLESGSMLVKTAIFKGMVLSESP